MSKARSRSAAILLALTIFGAVLHAVLHAKSATGKSARELCMSKSNAMFFGNTVPFCTAALKENQNDPELYAWRGKAFVYKEDYDSAIADLNEAIRLDPTIANAYAFRGFAWNGKRDFNKAIANADKAIMLDPNNSVAYNVRSVAHWNKSEYRGYISDWYISLKLDTQKLLYFIYRQLKLLFHKI